MWRAYKPDMSRHFTEMQLHLIRPNYQNNSLFRLLALTQWKFFLALSFLHDHRTNLLYRQLNHNQWNRILPKILAQKQVHVLIRHIHESTKLFIITRVLCISFLSKFDVLTVEIKSPGKGTVLKESGRVEALTAQKKAYVTEPAAPKDRMHESRAPLGQGLSRSHSCVTPILFYLFFSCYLSLLVSQLVCESWLIADNLIMSYY